MSRPLLAVDDLSIAFGSAADPVAAVQRVSFRLDAGETRRVALIMAAKMTSGASAHQEQPFTMMHSSAHDYYLQLAGGKRHLLVARNTPLPVVIEQELNFLGMQLTNLTTTYSV